MARRTAPKKRNRKATKAVPRSIRLPIDDDLWVQSQPHPQGFSGVVADAVRYYRENKNITRQTLLEAL